MSVLVVLLMMLTVLGVGALVCRFCPDVLVGLFPGGDQR